MLFSSCDKQIIIMESLGALRPILQAASFLATIACLPFPTADTITGQSPRIESNPPCARSGDH